VKYLQEGEAIFMAECSHFANMAQFQKKICNPNNQLQKLPMVRLGAS